MSEESSAETSNPMTVEEALFEYAAAFSDLQEIVEHHRGRSPEELLHQVLVAYDLDEAEQVLDREGISREEGFDPYSVRVKDVEFPDWKCKRCGNRPRLKFQDEPPFECSYCGAHMWVDDRSASEKADTPASGNQ